MRGGGGGQIQERGGWGIERKKKEYREKDDRKTNVRKRKCVKTYKYEKMDDGQKSQ